MGNLIVAFVIWNNSGAATLTDSRGNTYAAATARTAWSSGWSAQTFYAKSIAGGANTVTATFATSINQFAVVYIHEYSGLDANNPLDGRGQPHRGPQRDRDRLVHVDGYAERERMGHAAGRLQSGLGVRFICFT